MLGKAFHAKVRANVALNLKMRIILVIAFIMSEQFKNQHLPLMERTPSLQAKILNYAKEVLEQI